jgi:hypothetical protein
MDQEQCDRAPVELVTCPECGNVASIEWEARNGGLLHAKLRCIDRHWFLMPAEGITCYGTDSPYSGAMRQAVATERDGQLPRVPGWVAPDR